MIIQSIIIAIKEFFNIKKTIVSYGIELSPSYSSIFSYLIAEAITRESSFDLILKKSQHQNLVASIKHDIDKCFSRYCGYQVLLAYDSWVEEYNPTVKEIYEQLFRCLLALLVGIEDDFPIEVKTINLQVNELQNIVKVIFNNEENFKNEMLTYFFNLGFMKYRFYNRCINLDDFLYKTENLKYNAALNITIFASWQMGQTLKRIYNILLYQKVLSKEYVNNHKKTVISFLIESVPGQANSIKQKDINITWKEYISIACKKSNSFGDAFNCVKFILNLNIFYKQRFNTARFCEQIYLDDIQDFCEDSKYGILNCLHLLLIEQGRAAKRIIKYIGESDMYSQELIDSLKELLGNSLLLETHHNGIFIFKNYIFQAKRDSAGKLIFDENNIINIIKEIFVNSQKDLFTPLNDLIQEKIILYEKFENLWYKKNYKACSDIIYSSSIPEKIIEGFIIFLKENKNIILGSELAISELIYYYLLIFITLKNKIIFCIQKKIRQLLNYGVKPSHSGLNKPDIANF
ncbi:hypothetical protein A6S26_34510 [Nostoc sp. ATCC 43529]|nr:hypothetical protein A6S26_34510 [Nostoc sp. ATCC 43529]